MTEKKTCALCSQPVEISGFSLKVNNTELAFCCAGCQSIYQLINHDNNNHNNEKNDEIL